MKHSLVLLLRLFTSIENLPLSLASWATSFAAIVFLRYGIEQFLLGFPDRGFESVFLTLVHYFLEFLFVALLFMLIVRLVGRVNIEKAASFTLFGFLLILTPPITDYLILENPGIFSLYEFGTLRELIHNFFTFFDDTPDIGITYGIRLEIALATLVIGLYAWIKRRSILWGALGTFLTYLMLFVVSTLPSWLTFILLGWEKGVSAVTTADAIAIFLAPNLLFGQTTALVSAAHFNMALVYGVLDLALLTWFVFRYFPQLAWPLFRNARFPQLIYHGGLLCLGGLLASTFTSGVILWDGYHVLAVLLLIAAVECAWLASVVVNDLEDQAIDALTNPKRPLIEHTLSPSLYKTFGWLFFLTSLFLATLVYPRAILFLLGYQALAWLYSASPLRLKRLPVLASLLAAAASLLILFLGYMMISPSHSLAGLPWQLPAFLFIAYALVIPLKDLKDMAGDKQDGVYTLPVLVGERAAKHFLASAVFILFIASTIVLSLGELFLLALIFGGLGFWLIQKSTALHPRFNYHSLLGWIVALIASYGLLVCLFLMVLG